MQFGVLVDRDVHAQEQAGLVEGADLIVEIGIGAWRVWQSDFLRRNLDNVTERSDFAYTLSLQIGLSTA